ncbi:MAG: cytochrome c [bacterium]|nr:cytochrome c [bacterium]MCY4272939.1 cytochrome c [bacterium]
MAGVQLHRRPRGDAGDLHPQRPGGGLIRPRPRQGRTLGLLLLGGLFALAACGGGSGSEKPAAPSDPLDRPPEASEDVASEDVSAGQSVYLMRCVGCHGADGAGIVGPDIRPAALEGKYASAEAMEAIVREGLGDMPEFGSQLTDSEIADVVAYVGTSLG